VFGDLPERRTILTNDNAGFFCFNQYLAGICVKKDIGNSCCFRHNRFDIIDCLFGIFKDSGTDYNPLSQVAGKNPD